MTNRTAPADLPAKTKRPSAELRMYQGLKRITKYMTPNQIRRASEKDYGLSYEEALEMAYENVQQEARNAVKGVRRPKE